MPRRPPALASKPTASLCALGQKIRARRKMLGLSAVTTAESANLSRVTLHRIEKGEPSVTIGAYVGVLQSLGLTLSVEGDAVLTQEPIERRIRLADYPQLASVAWQVNGLNELTPKEALGLYERNWRHLEFEKMSFAERGLVERLVESVGHGHLLV